MPSQLAREAVGKHTRTYGNNPLPGILVAVQWTGLHKLALTNKLHTKIGKEKKNNLGLLLLLLLLLLLTQYETAAAAATDFFWPISIMDRRSRTEQ